jgi:hypothetical protein
MVQSHAPVLAPDQRAGTKGLFADGETPKVNASPPSETVDFDVSSVEKRVFARRGISY